MHCRHKRCPVPNATPPDNFLDLVGDPHDLLPLLCLEPEIVGMDNHRQFPKESDLSSETRLTEAALTACLQRHHLPITSTYSGRLATAFKSGLAVTPARSCRKPAAAIMAALSVER